MNVHDILKYGHGTFLKALERIPREQWQEPGVCGVWSTQDVIAHLASYETVLVDILTLIGGQNMPTPALDAFKSGEPFNDPQVEQRRGMDGQAVLAELNDAHESVQRIAATIPPERFTAPGTLPWYGAEYSLDDFIVYSFYGHKREHAAQLDVFADRK
jgi:uncharacterized protein (TIGR03083 family)